MKKYMLAAALLLGFYLSLTGCGGGSAGGSIVVPPSGGVTAISWTCTPTSLSVMSGQKVSCSVTLTGTGDLSVSFVVAGVPSTAVVITGNSLVLTAPDVAIDTVVTITTTSNQTSSLTGSIKVTVKPLVTTIISIAPDVFAFTNYHAIVVGVEINGSGFAAGESLCTFPTTELVLPVGVNPTKLVISIQYGIDSFSPGPTYYWVTKQGKCVDVPVDKSKLQRIVLLGDQNLGTVDPDPKSGEIFQYDPVIGVVNRFKPDGTPDVSNIPIGQQAHGIAFDNKSGLLIVDGSAYDPNQTDGIAHRGVGGTWKARLVTGIAAKDGYSCFSRSYEDIVSCYDLTGPTKYPDAANTSQAISSEPWAQAMVRMGSELDTLVYSRAGTPHLWRISVPDMQIKGSVATATEPINDQTANINSGCWLVAFDSGPAAGIAVLLTHADAMLTVVDIATMTVKKQVKLTEHFGSNIHPFRLATDAVHGTVIVAATVPGPSADLTRFASINVMDAIAATGPVPITDLAQTAKTLAVTFVTSPDGTKMYSCHRDEKLEVLPTQNTTASVSANSMHASSVAKAPLSASASSPSVPALEFSASRESVPPGEGIVLTWTAAGATSVTASGDWESPERIRTTTGAQVVVKKVVGDYNFLLTAVLKDGGTISKSVTIHVSTFVEPLPEITVSVPDWTANPLKSATVSFATEHADACSVSSPLFSPQIVPTNGSVQVAPGLLKLSAPTVTCTGPGGKISKPLY